MTEAGIPRIGMSVRRPGSARSFPRGIGDTIRVSLTGDPLEEVRVGYEILKSMELAFHGVTHHFVPDLRPGGYRRHVRIAQEIEERTRQIKQPLTVAIMGCEVNGPGRSGRCRRRPGGRERGGADFPRRAGRPQGPRRRDDRGLMDEIESMTIKVEEEQMIDRYTMPKMREIWSEENKFRKWLEVEIAACEAWASLGKIPREALAKIKRKAGFDIKRINEIEKETAHDLIAFLTSVAEKVGRESRFIHMGMTSYDVEDTARAMQMRDAADLDHQGYRRGHQDHQAARQGRENTVMMGRTHGVHAEPITFGLKLLVWVAEMERNVLSGCGRARETLRSARSPARSALMRRSIPGLKNMSVRS